MLPDTFAKSGLLIRPGAQPPTRFQVLGERSSGTNYLKRLLGRNTPLTPSEALGWKHGHIQALAIPRDMLVVVSLRNAADWALSMFAKPWHTPPDMQALPFMDFLQAPWNTIVDHPKYFANAGPLMVGQPLQQDRDPLTGLPYANLCALRTGKLRSHLSLLNRGCALLIARHETVLADPADFLATLRNTLHLPTPDTPLRPVVKRLGTRFNAASPRPPHPDALPPEARAYLRAHLDLPLESSLGYTY